VAAAAPQEGGQAVLDSEKSMDIWAALRAADWHTSLRVILSACGDTWIVEATRAGRAVEGRGTSPEAAWRAAYRQVAEAAPAGSR
jgi:hypothetical protein